MPEGSSKHFIIFKLWEGLPYMTSAVGGGGGSPKSRQNEQNQLIYVCDKGEEGVKKFENFVDVVYGCPLTIKGGHRR